MDDMANGGELLINIVRANKPKGLTGLTQKGLWPGGDAPASSPADVAPPANRQSLPHPMVTRAERGKPVTSPARESEP